MGRRKPTPYTIPTTWNGDSFKQIGPKFDKAFVTAVAELAADESIEFDSKHGVAPVMMNLIIGTEDIFRNRRARVRKRYRELKQQEKAQRDQQEEQAYKAITEFRPDASGSEDLQQAPQL